MSYAVAVLALLGLALLVPGYWAARRMLRPPRLPITRTPQEYGLSYESVAFLSKDGLNLKGWWIPARSECSSDRTDPAPVVLLLHPMFGNRAGTRSPRDGSTDPPALDLIEVAATLSSAGFAVMLFDFRSHGESQYGPCAGGYSEDQDVAGAVDYAFRRTAAGAPSQLPRVGMIGFGLGASAAITATGRVRGDARTIRVFSADGGGATGLLEFPPENIKLVSFLVAVEPVSLQTFAGEYLREKFNRLGSLLVPIVDRFCRRGSGYPLDGRLLGQLAEQVYTPTLFVQRCVNGRNRGDEGQQLYEAMPGPKQMWWIEGVQDRLGLYNYLAGHLGPVIAFGQQRQEATKVANDAVGV